MSIGAAVASLLGIDVKQLGDFWRCSAFGSSSSSQSTKQVLHSWHTTASGCLLVGRWLNPASARSIRLGDGCGQEVNEA